MSARSRLVPLALLLSVFSVLSVPAACSAPLAARTTTHAGTGGAGDTSTTGAGGRTSAAESGAGGSDGTEPNDAGSDVDDDAADATADATSDCTVLGVPGDCIDTAACAASHISTPGYCPGAADIECCTPFGSALCDPSLVPLPNAADITEAPGEGGCPPGMLSISAATPFCVDKYEASLVRADTGASWSPFWNPGTTAVRAVSVAGAVPQAYISGIEASDACTLAGKRLCADDEWLRACQGPDGTTYPYGNTDELGVCNDHRSEHPAIEYFGTSDSWIYTMLDNACLDQLPETVDLTGSRSGCVTAEGAYDMMGNVHEWTANPAGDFRGGYYMDTVLNGAGCLYVTTAHVTSYWDYSTGFRCCADQP